MRSSYAWTMKPWQRSEWRLGFNSVLCSVIRVLPICLTRIYNPGTSLALRFLCSWLNAGANTCFGALLAAEAVINYRAPELWKSGKSRKWQSIRITHKIKSSQPKLMLYPARWKKITADQSKVLKYWLYQLFRFGRAQCEHTIWLYEIENVTNPDTCLLRYGDWVWVEFYLFNHG